MILLDLWGAAPSVPKQKRARVGKVLGIGTAAIRYVHSTTPVIEWLMPDRLEKSAFAFHPLKGSVPGKREHDQ